MQSTNARVFWGKLSWMAPDFRLETPSGQLLLVFFDDELKRFVREHEYDEHRRAQKSGQSESDIAGRR